VCASTATAFFIIPALLDLIWFSPLPFHVLGLISLGIWCWTLNIHGLTWSGIDHTLLFDMIDSDKINEKKLTQSLYRISILISFITLSGMFLYSSVLNTLKNPDFTHWINLIPFICLLLIFYLAFWPFGGPWSKERSMLSK